MIQASRLAVVVLVAAGIAAACGGVTSPSENDIELFSGTLAVGGTNLHEFTADRNGEFEVRITALSPDPDAVLGLIFGRLQNGACARLQSNFAQLNIVALAGAITSGRHCITVADVGSLTAPANYTIRVSHP
jgi:hypothetical protein